MGTPNSTRAGILFLSDETVKDKTKVFPWQDHYLKIFNKFLADGFHYNKAAQLTCMLLAKSGRDVGDPRWTIEGSVKTAVSVIKDVFPEDSNPSVLEMMLAMSFPELSKKILPKYEINYEDSTWMQQLVGKYIQEGNLSPTEMGIAIQILDINLKQED